jgi:hypothetical protein
MCSIINQKKIKSMKNVLNLLSVLLLVLIATPNSFADAGASQKNKCKNGKRYKAKVKVNGPGCSKVKEKDKSCSAVAYNESLYIDTDCNCHTSSNPTFATGANAQAYAGPDGLFTQTYKTNHCRRYKAGGESANIPLPLKKSNYEGRIESTSRASNVIFDYDNNSVKLINYFVKLVVDSDDQMNEFAVAQLRMDKIIGEDIDSVDVLENIFHVQMSLKEGKLVIRGNHISLNQFTYTNNGYQTVYELSIPEMIIPLDIDINPEMDLEISFGSDVGNILDGDSEIEIKDTRITTSINSIDGTINCVIVSDLNSNAKLRVRDLSGNQIFYEQNIQLVSGQPVTFVIPNIALFNKGNIFGVFVEDDKGNLITNCVVRP